MILRPRRGRSGHLLIEALIAGAVLAIALTGVLAGSSKAERDLGEANADQQAILLAQEMLEAQRIKPVNSADWAPRVASGSFTRPQEASWPWTLTVTVAADAAMGAVGPVMIHRAVMVVSYRTRSVTLETIKW